MFEFWQGRKHPLIVLRIMWKTLIQRSNNIHEICESESGYSLYDKDLISLVNRFVEMRDKGTISSAELDALVKLLVSNYVEHKVVVEVDEILGDKLSDLCTASYA